MKEVIILGKGISWEECPFDGECWAASSVLGMPEIDVRKIHKVFTFDENEGALRYNEIAREHNIPIVSFKDYATEPYPIEDIKRELFDYFRPTASYMIAYAIYKGYEKLRLYGIDQGPDWDYLINKPYVMFWVGVARGRGIECEIPKGSILLESMGAEIKEYIQQLKAKIKTFTGIKDMQIH